jgi:hypothetical protein
MEYLSHTTIGTLDQADEEILTASWPDEAVEAAAAPELVQRAGSADSLNYPWLSCC